MHEVLNSNVKRFISEAGNTRSHFTKCLVIIPVEKTTKSIYFKEFDVIYKGKEDFGNCKTK